jgi:hypothetical protein
MCAPLSREPSTDSQRSALVALRRRQGLSCGEASETSGGGDAHGRSRRGDSLLGCFRARLASGGTKFCGVCVGAVHLPALASTSLAWDGMRPLLLPPLQLDLTWVCGRTSLIREGDGT